MIMLIIFIVFVVYGLWEQAREWSRLGRAAAAMRGTSITDGNNNHMPQECKERRHV